MALAGVRVVEFGSGAAGPIVTRYLAEQGATVIKIESLSRPDFLRIYALGPDNPHGYEGSTLFNVLNVNKKSITLNLKEPSGLEVARRIIHWADAVLENFAPKAMRGFGLDYESMAAEKPDLVMVSSCMNGQTGPQRNYPGFGTQGSALSDSVSILNTPPSLVNVKLLPTKAYEASTVTCSAGSLTDDDGTTSFSSTYNW